MNAFSRAYPPTTYYNQPPVPSATSTDVSSQAMEGGEEQPKSRRGSFGFLRRTKSSDTGEFKQPRRSFSASRKLTKRRNTLSKEEAARQRQQQEEKERAEQQPPQIPTYHVLPRLNPNLSNSPVPPSPNSHSSPARSKAVPFYQRPFLQSHKMASSLPDTPTRHAFAQTRAPAPDGSLPSPHGTAGPADSFTGSESMTNRGRYSYTTIGSDVLNSQQRKMRRRKDPTPFNIMVVGAKGCGKTSFIDFLRQSLTVPIKHRPSTPSIRQVRPALELHGSFTSHYLETDIGSERIGLTLYDSKGLERHLVDLQLREMSSFVEAKFTETFQEEQKVLRSTGAQDTHIHLVFLLLDPRSLEANVSAAEAASQKSPDYAFSARPRIIGVLDETLDVEVLRALKGKTTVIPVISKADTVTTAHMAFLKRAVWNSLKKVGFDPLEALNIEEDEDDMSDYATAKESGTNVHAARSSNGAASPISETDSLEVIEGLVDRSADTQGSAAPTDLKTDNHSSSSASHSTAKPTQQQTAEPPRYSSMSTYHTDAPDIPMSIISPDKYEPSAKGRRFAWGFADPYDTTHCDFVRLKDNVFGEWRDDLREAARERWYENWRTSRLKKKGLAQARSSGIGTEGMRSVSGAAAYEASGRPVAGKTTGRSSGVGLASWRESYGYQRETGVNGNGSGNGVAVGNGYENGHSNRNGNGYAQGQGQGHGHDRMISNSKIGIAITNND